LTQHGGQVVVEALCRQYGIWKYVSEADFPGHAGSHPAIRIIAQLLFSFTSGRTTVAEAAALGLDPILLQLVGLGCAADEVALRAWLNCQTGESVETLRRANWHLVQQSIGPAKADDGEDLRPLEVVFQDIQIQAGNASSPRRSWQTLSIGDFILDGLWDEGGEGESQCGDHLCDLLALHQKLWSKRGARFHAGNGPGTPATRKAMSQAGFEFWGAEIDYDTYYYCDIAMPKFASGKSQRFGDVLVDQYVPIYPKAPTEGKEGRSPRMTAEHICGCIIVARHNTQTYPMAYKYLVVPAGMRGNLDDLIAEYERMKKRAVIARSRLEGLSFEHQPGLHANAAYVAIATLACNLVTFVRNSVLPDVFREWANADIVRFVLGAPATRTLGAGQPKFRIHFPSALLSTLQPLLEAAMGPARRGRPFAADSLRIGRPLSPKHQARRSKDNELEGQVEPPTV
jgi:hypothetical protein